MLVSIRRNRLRGARENPGPDNVWTKKTLGWSDQTPAKQDRCVKNKPHRSPNDHDQRETVGSATPDQSNARSNRRPFLRSVSPAAVRHLPNGMARNIHRRLWPLWGTPSTHLCGPEAGSASPGGGLPALRGPPLPAPLLRSVSPAAVRHLPNELARNIHRRLWPLWGTPSTLLFGPLAGPVSPGGGLPAVGGPPLRPPFSAVRIDRVRWPPNQ